MSSHPRINLTTVAPDGFAALAAVETYLHGSGLEASLLHLIKMRVSQINGCAFCLHMHSEEAKKDGDSDVRLHLLAAWEESLMYTERERAALAWAESLTHIDQTHAPDEVYERARAQFSEKELADLTIACGMINAYNRIAIGLRRVHPADRRAAALRSA
jgi:AhpD family alkylhydroperoxidase